MLYKIICFFCINLFFLSPSYAQAPMKSYQEKINLYIETQAKDNLKLTRVQNRIQTLLTGNISWENRIILEYFDSKINEYFIEKASHGSHIQTPEQIKALYYSAYSASREDKIQDLIDMTQKLEINALMIDVKEVDGRTSFELSSDNFGNIQPSSNNRIQDISALIERLHEKNIYIIGRIVVFKDNYLSGQRPDLAIKWSYNHNKVWGDYKGNSYSDPYSKEVWDYHIEMASAIYKLGFDEINFDYVRFPTDGYISQTYYPHASEILDKNVKWGKMEVMEKFSSYITSKLKELHPDIILSADIFGLATHTDLFQIGQNIETFIPYFDYVAPMIYPSHYGKGYLGFSVPDNAPYEIFLDSMKQAKQRIDKLNIEIELAKLEGRNIKMPGEIISSQADISPIELSKVRPWLQAFHCSWCPGATSYNRFKFREQIRALKEYGLDSWYVWNASGRYENSWYNSTE